MKRNASLGSLVHDTTEAIADYARWPDVEARCAHVDQEIAILRNALKGHDAVVPTAIVMKIAADFLSEAGVRSIKTEGLHKGMIKLAELFAPYD